MNHDLPHRIAKVSNPCEEDYQALVCGINEHAKEVRGLNPTSALFYCARDNDGKMIAGIAASDIFGVVHVDCIWVDKNYRGRGYGKALIAISEEFGREKECSAITLYTLDWDALQFYQKLGFEIEFEREGYRGSSKAYSLIKKLKPIK